MHHNVYMEDVKFPRIIITHFRYTYGKGVAGKAMVAIEHPWHRWHSVPRQIVSDDGTMTTQVRSSSGMQTNSTFCIITRHFQKASFLLQDVLHLSYSMIFVNLPFFQNEDEGRIEKTVNLGNSGEATVTFSNEELKKYKLIQVRFEECYFSVFSSLFCLYLFSILPIILQFCRTTAVRAFELSLL